MLRVVLPTRATMPFRQAMLADPATMAYNAPWFPPDGCLPFPETEWDAWLQKWTGHEPERFCGFLADEAGELVAHCLDEGKALLDLTLEELKRFHPAFEQDVFDDLSMLACVEKRRIPGAPAPDMVRQAIDAGRRALEE